MEKLPIGGIGILLFLVSRHNASTIYFAANKLFKSTNRGDDWVTISPDLSRQLDRNKLPIMGQVWTMDAVMKNKSTTITEILSLWMNHQ